MNITMSLEESRSWRPGLEGNSDDILPFYRAFAEQAREYAVVCEFGVATGRSLIFLASEFVRLGKKAKLYGFDPWSSDFKPNWYAQSIRSIVSHATDAELEMLYLDRREPHFPMPISDLVFIDCLHTEATLLPNLEIAAASVIAGHDWCPSWPDVERLVTRELGEVNHFHSVWWKVM